MREGQFQVALGEASNDANDPEAKVKVKWFSRKEWIQKRCFEWSLNPTFEPSLNPQSKQR